MTARSKFDLVVIGADMAGLAAAGCAARRGAQTALLRTGGEAPVEGAVAEPPNAVWRLLDLQQYDLKFEAPPVHASIAEKRPLATSDDPVRDGRALASRESALEHLWPSFIADMGRIGAADGVDRYLSANAVLDDYFADEMLKTHALSLCAAPFGLAGDEAGSAQALGVAAAARRVIPAQALHGALLRAAEAAGVEIVREKAEALSRSENKLWKATLDGGEEIRAKTVMASSALIAEAFGLRIETGGSPLLRRQGVEAFIRLRIEKAPKSALARKNAVFFTAPDRAAIRRARDAMIAGEIDEEPPLTFEIVGREIIARAPYCPARLVENGEEREWSGQDRQILGRHAASVIEKRLGGGASLREIEVLIGPDVGAGLRRRDFDAPAVPAPPPSKDPVAAAAALALELTGDE
ncbi:MAG: hypothetical protein AB7F91_06360 [Parvularculaceae bacterium]